MNYILVALGSASEAWLVIGAQDLQRDLSENGFRGAR